MSGKDKTVEKYSNGLQCTVCYSEDCQEAIVVVSPLESAEKQFQSALLQILKTLHFRRERYKEQMIHIIINTKLF